MAFLRGLGHRLKTSAIRWFEPQLASLVSLMARTGVGTDACLEQKFLPVPVDFYRPIPDLEDLEHRAVWDRRSDLTGIDLRVAQQLELLGRLAQEYGSECDWPTERTANPLQFFTENNSFSFGCAAVTHCMLRSAVPSRIIEVGSGNSSLVLRAAIERNSELLGRQCAYTIIDPHPRPPIRDSLSAAARFIEQKVETVDVGLFETLDENDILFIDSGHTVRTGGDVNFLILDVLPRLKPGVIVHLHDIDLPYEYPKVYFTNPAFRVFWTESYLLQAFLCFNSQFEVLLAMRYIMRDHEQAFREAFPQFEPSRHRHTSGSFWIRRVRRPD